MILTKTTIRRDKYTDRDGIIGHTYYIGRSKNLQFYNHTKFVSPGSARSSHRYGRCGKGCVLPSAKQITRKIVYDFFSVFFLIFAIFFVIFLDYLIFSDYLSDSFSFLRFFVIFLRGLYDIFFKTYEIFFRVIFSPCSTHSETKTIKIFPDLCPIFIHSFLDFSRFF